MRSVQAATEELSTSIEEIGRQVTAAGEVVQEASGQAESTTNVVSELASSASRIGDVIRLIQEIAEQTNLLALNATHRSGACRRSRTRISLLWQLK